MAPDGQKPYRDGAAPLHKGGKGRKKKGQYGMKRKSREFIQTKKKKRGNSGGGEGEVLILNRWGMKERRGSPLS